MAQKSSRVATPAEPKLAAKSRTARDLLQAAAELDGSGDSASVVEEYALLRRRAEAEGLRLVNFEVTEEPLPDPVFDRIAPAERDRILEISRIMNEDPDSAGPLRGELEDLARRHPEIPMLRNHLSMALQAEGEYEAAADVVAETARLFPKYVFGFSNYVMQLLGQGRIADARELVEDGPRGGLLWLTFFDPDRSVFHVTEVVTFAAAIGHYMLSTDQEDAAERYLEICLDLLPDHPMARHLEHRMERHMMALRLRQALAEAPWRRRGTKSASSKKRKSAGRR